MAVYCIQVGAVDDNDCIDTLIKAERIYDSIFIEGNTSELCLELLTRANEVYLRFDTVAGDCDLDSTLQAYIPLARFKRAWCQYRKYELTYDLSALENAIIAYERIDIMPSPGWEMRAGIAMMYACAGLISHLKYQTLLSSDIVQKAALKDSARILYEKAANVIIGTANVIKLEEDRTLGLLTHIARYELDYCWAKYLLAIGEQNHAVPFLQTLYMPDDTSGYDTALISYCRYAEMITAFDRALLFPNDDSLRRIQQLLDSNSHVCDSSEIELRRAMLFVARYRAQGYDSLSPLPQSARDALLSDDAESHYWKGWISLIRPGNEGYQNAYKEYSKFVNNRDNGTLLYTDSCRVQHMSSMVKRYTQICGYIDSNIIDNNIPCVDTISYKDINLLLRLLRENRYRKNSYVDRAKNLCNFDVFYDMPEGSRTFFKGLIETISAEVMHDQNQYSAAANTFDLIPPATIWYKEGQFAKGKALFHLPQDTAENVNIYETLIREDSSVRAAYRLAELLKSHYNYRQAIDIYEKVSNAIDEKYTVPDYYFIRNNTDDGLARCRRILDGNNQIRPQLCTNLEIGEMILVYPDNLCMVNIDNKLERFSCEMIEDTLIAGRQYAEETLEEYLLWGKPKLSLYPSRRLPGSILEATSFPEPAEGPISDRIYIDCSWNLNLSLYADNSDSPTDVDSIIIDDTLSKTGAKVQYDTISGRYLIKKVPYGEGITIAIYKKGYYTRIHSVPKHYYGEHFDAVRLSPVVDYMSTVIDSARSTEYIQETGQSEIYYNQFTPYANAAAKDERTSFPDKENRLIEHQIRDAAYYKGGNCYLGVSSDSKSPLWRIEKNGDIHKIIVSPPLTSTTSLEGIAVSPDDSSKDSVKVYLTDWAGGRVLVGWVKDNTCHILPDPLIGVEARDSSENNGEILLFPTRVEIEIDADTVECKRRNDESIKVSREPHLFIADYKGIHVFDTLGNYLDKSFYDTKTQTEYPFAFYIQGYGENARIMIFNRTNDETIIFSQ